MHSQLYHLEHHANFLFLFALLFLNFYHDKNDKKVYHDKNDKKVYEKGWRYQCEL